ncbi:fimbria/pilus outer membrane usher protein [Enterobacter cloacae]|uniref:fimbria/pilus outer membrane usher protein n=1 Tax=Enterobacter cloacae TaxID=550 RepID=UPI002A460E38|nr:fimbria/pilus outer membrane usher protein [Enterobacter cloacae]
MKMKNVVHRMSGLIFVMVSKLTFAYTFDSRMIGVEEDIDIAVLNQGGQLPGKYPVSIVLNGEIIDFREINFYLVENLDKKPTLQPCLSVELLSKYGVRVEDYPGLTNNKDTKNIHGCAALSSIPNAYADFIFNQSQLQLNIQQASMRPKLKGIAPSILWDDGIPAAILNYRASFNRIESRNFIDKADDSYYLALEPGLNIGAWRIRNSTYWNNSDDHSGGLKTMYTYGTRGINDLKSRLTIGDRFTPSDVFDSIPFRGVMFSSDEAMIPYNERTYSPVIRGVARTQARVEVRLNGYIIASEIVAPGAFALTDLSLSDMSGDLLVTVVERDGTTQFFTVPFSTPAIALREGYSKYNFILGQYRSSNPDADEAKVGQVTFIHGLPWDLTLYSGGQLAEIYQSYALGLGIGLGRYGNASFDVTEACGYKRSKNKECDDVWRIRYNKNIDLTDTNLNITSQLFGLNYNTFTDVHDSSYNHYFYNNLEYKKNMRHKIRTTVSIGQQMGIFGNLNLSGTRETYWNRPGVDDSLGIGYGFSTKYASFSLNWRQHYTEDQSGTLHHDRVTSFQISIPLNFSFGQSNISTYQFISSSQNAPVHEVGAGGQLFDNQLVWNTRQQYKAGLDNTGKNISSVYLGWSDTHGQINANYSYSPSFRQINSTMSGSLLLHQNGLTAGQWADNTIGLVEAPGAKGVPVGGSPGVKTDFRGYTTIANLNPYQVNNVSVNTAYLPADTEILEPITKVVPTAGAIVPVIFPTRTGGRALITLRLKSGKSVPFGAVVTIKSQNSSTGIVDENGQVFLTGVPDNGKLSVIWGGGGNCNADFKLPEQKSEAGLYVMNELCH